MIKKSKHERFLAELAKRLLLSDVVAERVELRFEGKEYSGLCPFHVEKTPSFVVNDTTGVYRCFGCGAIGNAVMFVMSTEELSVALAFKKLADMAGLDAPKRYAMPGYVYGDDGRLYPVSRCALERELAAWIDARAFAPDELRALGVLYTLVEAWPMTIPSAEPGGAQIGPPMCADFPYESARAACPISDFDAQIRIIRRCGAIKFVGKASGEISHILPYEMTEEMHRVREAVKTWKKTKVKQ